MTEHGPAASPPTELRPSHVDEHAGAGAIAFSARGPYEAARLSASGGLLVDIRPQAQRAEFGEIPGAIVVERNVLEWRLDPSSPNRHDAVTGPQQDIVVVCQAGYASSLAAASLLELGLSRATDLVGGYEAWAKAGLPTSTAGGAAE